MSPESPQGTLCEAARELTDSSPLSRQVDLDEDGAITQREWRIAWVSYDAGHLLIIHVLYASFERDQAQRYAMMLQERDEQIARAIGLDSMLAHLSSSN